MVQIAHDVQQRIIAIAEQLHTENPEKFPSVAEVRSLSKADMNSVSAVMKAWRATKMIPVQRIAEDAPPEIQAEAKVLISTVWMTAKEQAEMKLREAEARYTEEREEAEQLRSELSIACDDLQQQLDNALDALKEITTEKNMADQAWHETIQALKTAETKIINLEQSERLANAKNTELEKHISTIKIDLEQSKMSEKQAIDAKAETLITVKEQSAEINQLAKLLNDQKDQLHLLEKSNMKLADQHNKETAKLEKEIVAEKSKAEVANAKAEQAQLHIKDLRELLDKAALSHS